MALKRIKIPTLPSRFVNQRNGYFRDIKTGQLYLLSTLQRLYGTEAKTQPKQEHISSDMKHEQITNSRWDLNY